MKTQQMLEILGVVNRGEGKKGFWTKIGVGFRNGDGSVRLIFNYIPADLAHTTIQLREPRAAKGEGDELEQVTES